MFGSALFFAISFAKPLRRLSVERPEARVLNRRLIATVCLQTCCHVLGLVLAAYLAGGYEPEKRGPEGAGGGAGGGAGAGAPSPASFLLDGEADVAAVGAAAVAAAEAAGGAVKSAAEKLLAGLSEGEAAASGADSWFSSLSFVSTFRPNAINTAVWLLTTASQTATFVTCYHGEPFMAPLARATTLYYGTLAVYAVTVLGALGWSSDLNSYFQLVPLPSEQARQLLALLIVADGVLCFGVDRLIRRYL
jgi:magnesium-transporting ATPase (P-type)